MGDAAEVDQVSEESLEARGRDDLQDPGRLVAGVPERVPLVARLEDEIAGAADHDVIAQQRTDTSLEDVAVLVLARVPMHRRSQRARRHGVFDEREPTPGLLAIDHEPNPDAPQEARLAVPGTHHLRRRRRHSYLGLSLRRCS